MQGQTHLVGGLTIVGATALIPPITMLALNPASVAGVALGTLMPDIDHPHSTISHVLPFGGLGLQHRTWTHSLLLLLVLSGLALFLGRTFAVAFFVGYLSHLLLDMLNPTGIPWLYPFNKKKQRWARIYVGSTGEYAVLAGMILLDLGLFFLLKKQGAFGAKTGAMYTNSLSAIFTKTMALFAKK
jgi:inner membrane protein